MFKTGICSVTFRQLEPLQVIELVKDAGLDGIEWGGDVHVPPGEISVACNVRKMTQDAGLNIAAYGSYYKVLNDSGTPQDFLPVLDSALALGAETIRIWAGSKASDSIMPAEKALFITTLCAALDMAQAQGVRLAVEFHAKTLSDNNESAVELFEEVNHSGLVAYWQPIFRLQDPEYRLEGLKQLSNHISNLHVYHWKNSAGPDLPGRFVEDRRPLADGADEWNHYFSVPLNPALDHYALLEFVRNDDPEQFLKDAAVLKSWLAEKGLSANSLCSDYEMKMKHKKQGILV